MSKHTPGPWRLPAPREDYAGACVVRRDGFIVADCNIFGLGKNSPSESECEANALLIAAAPDLLAACKAARSVAAHMGWNLGPAGKAIEDAIAKAEGGGQ